MKLMFLLLFIYSFQSFAETKQKVTNKNHDKEHQHVEKDGDHEHTEEHHKPHDHKAHHPDHDDELKKKEEKK